MNISRRVICCPLQRSDVSNFADLRPCSRRADYVKARYTSACPELIYISSNPGVSILFFF